MEHGSVYLITSYSLFFLYVRIGLQKACVIQISIELYTFIKMNVNSRAGHPLIFL